MFKKHGWKLSLIATGFNFVWNLLGNYQQAKQLNDDMGGVLTWLFNPWLGLILTVALLLWAKDWSPWRADLSNEAVLKEWGKLEKRFAQLDKNAITASHRLQDALAIVRADKFDEAHNPECEWRIQSHDSDCQKNALALCAQAGALLLHSVFDLPVSVRRIKSDRDRWLSYLMSQGEAVEADMRMELSSYEDGEHKNTMYLDEIPNVAQASTRACIKCKANQLSQNNG